MRNRRSGRSVAVAAAGVMVAAAGAAVPLTASSSVAAPANPKACDNRDNNSYSKLLGCVSAAGVTKHLKELQAIADANGGTRATETPGYKASVDYVVKVLEQSGWTAEIQPFTYNASDTALQQLTPTPATYDHAGATGTGEGDVTAAVVPIDIKLDGDRQNTSGCEAADFAGGAVVGKIALLQRGGCNFSVKALNADAAGAAGVIIFNQGDTLGAGDRLGVISPTLGGDNIVDIPVVGTSFAAGQSLAQPGSTARVSVKFRKVTDYNVIGELKGEVDDNIVMAGAHLDSVPAGPGINDNGSGSSGLLDVVEALGNHEPRNTIRFAWWGAEEIGLLGSSAWVAQQSQAQKDEIALYLNFDMIGSPNYYFGIYDANQSSFKAPDGVTVPAGSTDIEKTLESFYTYRGEPYDDSAFSGRSDYQAFINNGIPSGGLFTGAEVVKTAKQAEVWGGTAGKAFDPCYHIACDTIANVNQKALDVNSDAVAFAVLTYAYSTEGVNGVKGIPVPGKFTIPAPAGPEHTFAGPLGGDDGHDHDHEPVAS